MCYPLVSGPPGDGAQRNKYPERKRVLPTGPAGATALKARELG